MGVVAGAPVERAHGLPRGRFEGLALARVGRQVFGRAVAQRRRDHLFGAAVQGLVGQPRRVADEAVARIVRPGGHGLINAVAAATFLPAGNVEPDLLLLRVAEDERATVAGGVAVDHPDAVGGRGRAVAVGRVERVVHARARRHVGDHACQGLLVAVGEAERVVILGDLGVDIDERVVRIDARAAKRERGRLAQVAAVGLAQWVERDAHGRLGLLGGRRQRRDDLLEAGALGVQFPLLGEAGAAACAQFGQRRFRAGQLGFVVADAAAQAVGADRRFKAVERRLHEARRVGRVGAQIGVAGGEGRAVAARERELGIEAVVLAPNERHR